MLFIVFQVAGESYALGASSVVEVMPLLRMRPMPGAPDFVCGVCVREGLPVPVIDLSKLICGTASSPSISSRILLVKESSGGGAGGGDRLIGLLAERVSCEKRSEDSFQPAGVATPGEPWLGDLSVQKRPSLQILSPERILNEELRALLFGENAGAGA